MYHCKVDEFPMVCEWPVGARDPVLECIVFFDTFQVKVSPFSLVGEEALTWVATKSLETFRNGLQQKRE
jgi:hypothetical protein